MIRVLTTLGKKRSRDCRYEPWRLGLVSRACKATGRPKASDRSILQGKKQLQPPNLVERTWSDNPGKGQQVLRLDVVRPCQGGDVAPKPPTRAAPSVSAASPVPAGRTGEVATRPVLAQVFCQCTPGHPLLHRRFCLSSYLLLQLSHSSTRCQ